MKQLLGSFMITSHTFGNTLPGEKVDELGRIFLGEANRSLAQLDSSIEVATVKSFAACFGDLVGLL